MNEVQPFLFLIPMIIMFVLGFWSGIFREKCRQSDLRMKYSASDEFKQLPFIEQTGAFAMWKWLREHS